MLDHNFAQIARFKMDACLAITSRIRSENGRSRNNCVSSGVPSDDPSPPPRSGKTLKRLL